MKKLLTAALLALCFAALVSGCRLAVAPIRFRAEEIRGVTVQYQGKEARQGKQSEINALVPLLNGYGGTFSQSALSDPRHCFTVENQEGVYSFQLEGDLLACQLPDGQHVVYQGDRETLDRLAAWIDGSQPLSPAPTPFPVAQEDVDRVHIQYHGRLASFSSPEDEDVIQEVHQLLRDFEGEEASMERAQELYHVQMGLVQMSSSSSEGGRFYAWFGENFLALTEKGVTDMDTAIYLEGPEGYFQPLFDLVEERGVSPRQEEEK